MTTALKAFITNNVARELRADYSTHHLLMMLSEHGEVHEGKTYTLEDSNADVNATPLHLSFTTPDTEELTHLLINYDVAGQAEFVFTEAPTGGLTGGTAATPLNRRRSSTNVSDWTNVLKGAAAPTGGTTLTDRFSGGAQGNASTPGGTRGQREWNLKPNTSYSLRITSTTAGANGFLELVWYSHSDLG